MAVNRSDRSALARRGETRCVLFDFGDTIAREPFFIHPPPECPDWANRVAEVIGPATADRWSLGELTWDDLTAALSTKLGLDSQVVHRAMEDDCRNLRLNAAVVDFARRLAIARVPTALVTVNSDIFSLVIAPHYRLHELFPIVVASWEERLLDKTELCRRALRRIDSRMPISAALLIDNIAENVEAFRHAGGRAYHFRGEARFIADLERDPWLKRSPTDR
ncbi:MAG TPA: hypothetical protein VII63_09885 [Caulobacteraceae bacterium]